jgi:hypothetical protein
MNIRNSAIAAMTASLALAGLATPTLAAQDRSYAVARPGESQPASATTRTRAAESDRRVCVSVEMTGTRVARRVCRTEAEWEAQGGLPSRD